MAAVARNVYRDYSQYDRPIGPKPRRKKKGKSKKTTTKRKTSMAKRGRKKKSSGKRRKSVASSTKRRGKKRGPKRGSVRRASSRKVKVRRRRSRRGGGMRMNSRGIVGMLKQAAFDGLFVVGGDVAANLAKILSGQTGIAGNAAQLAGGFAAGFVLSKYVSKDAGRMAMAGAAAGIVKQIITDNVVTALPAGDMKTKLTAALQGYPHSDYQALQGYVNSGAAPIGVPGMYGAAGGGFVGM